MPVTCDGEADNAKLLEATISTSKKSHVISSLNNTIEALDQIRSRFFEFSKFAEQPDLEENLFKRWELK